MSESMDGRVVVLGTGGTIAGVSPSGDDRQYRAAQLSVADLVAAVPALGDLPLEAVQVAQVDSKDMGWPVWGPLLAELARQAARPEVAGVVITHGTDTLEETACLLHALAPAGKPIVLTAAMRPATSTEADGPRNLSDAVHMVRWAHAGGEHGVVVVMNGTVWAGRDVRKAHTTAIDAFDGGGRPAIGSIKEGVVSPLRPWPRPLGWVAPSTETMASMPRVELVTSHAGADGLVVAALLSAAAQAPLRGLVVAGTGHGTIHQALEGALAQADRAGVAVWRSSRVPEGGVQGRADERWPAAGHLTPAQARLMLSLMLALRLPPDPALLAL